MINAILLFVGFIAALWYFHKRVVAGLVALANAMDASERSLRSHVVDEIDHLEQAFHARVDGTEKTILRTEQGVINYVKTHAEDLRRHAEDLRNHAKDISDRAEVQNAPPRQAVTRN